MTGLFTPPTDIAPVTKALSVDINNLSAAIEVMDNKLPTEAEIKRGTINFGVDSGVADAYIVTLPYVPSGYVDGLEVNFSPLFANTGASTINVNGLGVKSIRRLDGTALLATDINAGAVIAMRYATATGFFHIAGSSGTGSTGAPGPEGPPGPTGPAGASGTLTKVEVAGTTQAASAGNDYWPTGAACAVTVNATPVDAERFRVTPANGLSTNTILFGAATVQGYALSTTGTITMNPPLPMTFQWSSTISKWVLE